MHLKHSSQRTLLAATLLLTSTAPAQSPLKTLQDHNCVLLLFAPTSGSPEFARQQALLKNHASDLADRDLICIPVLSTWVEADASLRQKNATFTTDAEQNHLRRRYNIQAQSFTVVLLGKDGGEKLRSSIPVTMDKLAAFIDSMPMRQQQLRQRTIPAPSK